MDRILLMRLERAVATEKGALVREQTQILARQRELQSRLDTVARRLIELDGQRKLIDGLTEEAEDSAGASFGLIKMSGRWISIFSALPDPPMFNIQQVIQACHNERFGITQQSVRNAIQRFAQAGIFEPLGRGQYKMTQSFVRFLEQENYELPE